MRDLVAFLRARLDDDEQTAREAAVLPRTSPATTRRACWPRWRRSGAWSTNTETEHVARCGCSRVPTPITPTTGRSGETTGMTGNPVAGWIELPDKNTKANAEPFAMRDLFPIVIELDEVPDNAIRAMVGLPPQH